MTPHLQKAIDIALKDLSRSFRNAFGLLMMFVTPTLITAILYFAFGSLFRSDGGFDVPLTRVQAVNLDAGSPQWGGFSAGGLLIDFLQDERLSGLLQITEAADETTARSAVDSRAADVAIIIPPNFTAAVVDPNKTADVTLVQDPTLTLGPSIVKGLVSQLVDSFSGTKIAAATVAKQFDQWGIAADPQLFQSIANEYAYWAAAFGEMRGELAHPALDLQRPPSKAEPKSMGAEVAGLVMVGMMIFFSFFTGATTAGTIINEEENGTLARLFTTPTTLPAILGGKLASVFATVLIQVVILTLLTAAIFGVDWGEPLTVALATLGLVVVTSSFGILLVSFVKNSRQLGSVMGSLLTLAGMVGGLFSAGIPGLPGIFGTIQLLTPQGWALRTWQLTLAGATTGDVALPVAVLLGMSAVFFAIGVFRFSKRFT